VIRQPCIFLAAICLSLAPPLSPSADAQTPAQATLARVQITAPVDNDKRSVLPGSLRPEARAANDRGLVPDALPMRHLQLLLARPAEREAALVSAIKDLHDRASPHFQHWLNVAQLGERYGLAAADLTVITRWLEQQGFTVNTVYPGLPLIDFSGTAGAVRAAFNTEIHYLDVHGVRHLANMSNPQIPAALAPAIRGIVSLHDFRPHTDFKAKVAHPFPRRAYTPGNGYTAVVPADLATIYNLYPLFSDAISGKGQTIVVIEDSNVYSAADWSTFRSTFGLASAYPYGSFTQQHPASSGTNNCSNPGVVSGDEFEATLDAEWASAAAPNAAIVLASCASTQTFGGLIALENLVNSSNPPAIVSISYGECEAANGAAANSTYNSVYLEAVAFGTSVFVSAGDEGAASCDANASNATHGIGVSGLASSPYDVAVGGTDFGDTYAGTTYSYWSTANSVTYGSALSYIPEIPWNDSCASALFASYYGNYGAGYGNGSPYGTNGFCNSATGEGSFLTTASGSGGPSGCATGAAATAEVVGGTCGGYAKPSWQSVVGNPADKLRDLPDVSLFAANGAWDHYYVLCDSDTGDGGTACSGAPSSWSGAGGTSFAAPIMAGIQALVNQSTGARQGNPNPMYYAIAAAEYGSTGSGVCNSSNGNAVSVSCAFYDVTLGDMDVNCTGTINCYLSSGSYGVLSTSTSSYAKAYGAGIGWDFATGIGSVNAAVLVNGWNTSDLTLTGSGKVTTGGLLSYALTLTNSGPPTATSVVVKTTVPAGVSLVTGSSSSGCTQSGQTVSCTVGNLSKGSSDSLTLVFQPGNTQAVNLSFSVTAGNGVLFPANDVVAIALTSTSGGAGPTDGPLPPWALGMFGAGLIGIASRRLRNARR
jgi:uncharacterized repeat protein (TIGR01451 family)